MPVDNFDRRPTETADPASRSFDVVAHDANELAFVTTAIYVGTGGNLKLRLENDLTDRTFKNLPGGSMLWVRSTHIRATGTTAADLIGLSG